MTVDRFDSRKNLKYLKISKLKSMFFKCADEVFNQHYTLKTAKIRTAWISEVSKQDWSFFSTCFGLFLNSRCTRSKALLHNEIQYRIQTKTQSCGKNRRRHSGTTAAGFERIACQIVLIRHVK